MRAVTRARGLLARGFERPGLSLRDRIVVAIAVLSALGFLAAGAAALLVERRATEERAHRVIAQEVAEFSELARTGVDPQTRAPFDDAERLLTVFIARNLPDEHEVFLGYIPDAVIVSDPGEGPLRSDPGFRSQVTRYEEPATGSYDHPEAGQVRYAAMPVVSQGRRSHFVAAYFLDRELAELSDTIRSYASAAVLAWAVLLGAALFLVGRITRPIEELTATSAAISETDLSTRLDVRGRDEVATLARQFNSMLDRIQEALGSQRVMLDDAGHELRTPITVIKGHLELMDAADPQDVEQVRALALDELGRMGVLVEDLILLAKARRPDFLRPREVDVAAIVEDSLAKAQPLGDRRWVADQIYSRRITADPQRLTQAVLQLAANAVAATRPGDTIGFGAAGTPSGVQLWVRDTGPGVPEAEREAIFERRRSGSGGRPGGSGLGLAIVAAIARAHGGTAWVTESSLGGGARFVLELPASPTEVDQDEGPEGRAGHRAPRGPSLPRHGRRRGEQDPGRGGRAPHRELRRQGPASERPHPGGRRSRRTRPGLRPGRRLRPARPRHRAARYGWLRGAPRAPGARLRAAGDHPDRSRLRRRHDRGIGGRRRRLHEQAVQLRRAAGPHPAPPAVLRRGERRPRGAGRRASHLGPAVPAGACLRPGAGSPPGSSRSWRPLCVTQGRC